LQNIDETFLEH